MAVETPAPEPISSRLNLWAILLGSVVDILATALGAGLVLGVSAGNLIASLIFGLAMTALGGYVAAAVAGRRSLAHGLGVGVLSTVSALVLARLGGEDAMIEFPLWYQILAYVLTLPAAVTGGWVRRRFWGDRPVESGGRAGAYPNLKQAIWLVLLSIFMTAAAIGAAGVAATLVIRGRAAALGWTGPAVLTGAIAGYALVLIWAVRKARAPAGEIFPIKMVPTAWLWPALVTVVGAGIVFAEVGDVVRRALPIPRGPIDPITLFGGIEDFIWVAVVLIVVLAPIAEELLFRGIILRGFLSHYPARKAILVSALLFGFFHLNPFQFVTATILGVLFAWWRIRTGSLFLPLLGHGLNNALALALPRLPWLGVPDAVGTAELFKPLWLALGGGLLLLLGILTFIRVSRGSITSPES